MRDSFIFYRSFFEAIDNLPQENQTNIYKAIAEFSLNNKEIELKGVEKTVFILIKPQLEANNKKYINGTKEKKQKISKIEAKNKQNRSKTQGNVNVNVNVNDNVNENVNVNINEIAEDLYSLYALKKGKKTGVEKLITYLRKSKDVETDIKKIKQHIENYNQACKKDNYKFMKHFNSYINQQVWNDEVVVETKQESKIDLNICIEDIKKGTARFEPQSLSIWYSRGFANLTQEQVKIIQGGINGK